MTGIPVYLGLLKFMLPDAYDPAWRQGAILLLPPIGFMAGASLSIAGYMPRLSTFSLDLPDEIEAERHATIHRRRQFALGAALLFALVVLLSVVIAFWALKATAGVSTPQG